MPSDWGLVLGGLWDQGLALQGQAQGPPEGPELRLPSGSVWAAGTGRGREGRGSCRCSIIKIICYAADDDDVYGEDDVDDDDPGGRAEQFSISRREGSCSEA